MTMNVSPAGLAQSFLGLLGQASQSAHELSANVDKNSNVNKSASTSDAEKAQAAATEKTDASQARLIALQADADIRKQTNDVNNAIRSGKEDTANKAISAEAQNAKGISY